MLNNMNQNNSNGISVTVKASNLTIEYSCDGMQHKTAAETYKISAEDIELQFNLDTYSSSIMEIVSKLTEKVKESVKDSTVTKETVKPAPANDMMTKYQSLIDNDALVSEINESGFDTTFAGHDIRYIIRKPDFSAIKISDKDVVANIAIKSDSSISIIKYGVSEFAEMLDVKEGTPKSNCDILEDIMSQEDYFYTTCHSECDDNDGFVITVITVYGKK